MDFSKVIIISDLDGTLLDSEKQIAEKDIAAINRFREGGGVFTVATGRGNLMAESVVRKLDIHEPCVIFNGAAVYDFDKRCFLWHCELQKRAREYITALEERFPDIGIEILCEDVIYVTKNNIEVEQHMSLERLTPTYKDIKDVPDGGWVKALIAYPPEKIWEIIEFTKNNINEGVNYVHSAPRYYEMLPDGISKGAGFKKLLSLTGYEERFTVAAGDYGNDRDMIYEADLGVAVGNALDSVKDAAKLIVSDNDHAPISEIIDYIEKY